MVAKFYTEDFKREAAKLAVENNQPISHTAKELGVSSSGLRKWIAKYGEVKE